MNAVSAGGTATEASVNKDKFILCLLPDGCFIAFICHYLPLKAKIANLHIKYESLQAI